MPELADVVVGASDTLVLFNNIHLAGPYALTLKGTLLESTGSVVSGAIEAVRTVGKNIAEDFGGIGAEVRARDAAPGVTLVRRVTGERLGGGGHTSILRYFDISPAEGEYHRCALTPRAGVDLRPQIFSLVRERGWKLRELTRSHHSLEDIFVHVTKAEREDF